ncbi:MAG TPA: transposase [Nitrospinota bacterium]|jgi:REP element-mobilizing transposase RayT|nr:transposase [Nitrospinota bacterium]
MAKKYNPETHHRRSIRLKGYDYRQAGVYFITICSWDRQCMFGNILNKKMPLNKFGQIVEKEWLQTGVVRTNIKLDVFIVMPNHIHDITM